MIIKTISMSEDVRRKDETLSGTKVLMGERLKQLPEEMKLKLGQQVSEALIPHIRTYNLTKINPH